MQTFTLVLAITLSVGSQHAANVFSVGAPRHALTCMMAQQLPATIKHSTWQWPDAGIFPQHPEPGWQLCLASPERLHRWHPCPQACACDLQMVFGVISLGAIVLTLNVVLLGGNIGFFQSMCLLGYCIFPLDIAAIITVWVTNIIARYVVVVVALIWSSWASVPFIGGSVSPARRALAVFPLLLLYTFIAWLALMR